MTGSCGTFSTLLHDGKKAKMMSVEWSGSSRRVDAWTWACRLHTPVFWFLEVEANNRRGLRGD